MTVDWQSFADQVRSHDSFILVSHIRPDCDALGSELGMKEVLESIGKSVHIINAHPTPESLTFIDPSKSIQVLGEHITADEILADPPDCLMVLDTSAWKQLGAMGDVIRDLSCDKMVLDHHVGQDDLGATFHKNTTAEATGHLVVQAADQLGVDLTPTMSMPLYAAIATDTGWFRFPSVTPETYRVVARLVDAGASPSNIYADLYECDTIGRLRLRGLTLSRTQSELDGRLVYTHIDAGDFEKTGASPHDTEDVINLTLTVAGTEAAVIFVGLQSGGYKLSFRSRCKMDCSEVARKFDGGGHKAAAGASHPGPLEKAQQEVLAVVRSAMT